MRITTNMIRRNYQNNLSSTLGGLELSRRQVETGRRVAYAYEDPSSAYKGAVLERRYARNADYTDSTKNGKKWLSSQEGVLDSLNDDAVNIVENFSVSAMSDPSGDVGREAYAKQLREIQKNMVFALNTQYGDAYVMAGNDGMNPPFVLSEDGKTLTYRGVDVDVAENPKAIYSYDIKTDTGSYRDSDVITVTGAAPASKTYDLYVRDDGTGDITTAEANDPQQLAKAIAKKMDGKESEEYTITAEGNKIIYTAKNGGAIGDTIGDGTKNPPAAAPGGFTITSAHDDGNGNLTPNTNVQTMTGSQVEVQQGVTGTEEYKELYKFSQEKAYIDLGFGMKFDTEGNVIPSSAFDTALPGINVVGFGIDDDGLSNNMISLVGQMAEILEQDEFDSDAYGTLWMKLKSQTNELQNESTTIGAKYNLLETTEDRLSEEKLHIEEQYKDTVGIEEADAITNFVYAQYVYNVALKIGTNIINPSLLDFMNS